MLQMYTFAAISHDDSDRFKVVENGSAAASKSWVVIGYPRAGLYEAK